jgi:hypothetical protein
LYQHLAYIILVFMSSVDLPLPGRPKRNTFVTITLFLLN